MKSTLRQAAVTVVNLVDSPSVPLACSDDEREDTLENGGLAQSPMLEDAGNGLGAEGPTQLGQGGVDGGTDAVDEAEDVVDEDTVLTQVSSLVEYGLTHHLIHKAI